jgi:hypothetical protein
MKKFFFIQKKLKKYENENFKIIDLGARNQILKNFIPKNFIYKGVDKFKNNNDNLIINLDNGFDNLGNNYDIVFALDIIEHTNDPYNFIKNCMNLSKNLIYLVLPNAAYYSFRFNFLIKGELTNKFHFSGKSNDDRHKWFTNYKNTKKFLTQFQNDVYNIKIEKILKNRNKFKFLYYIEKLLSKFLPNLFSWSFLITFQKKY